MKPGPNDYSNMNHVWVKFDNGDRQEIAVDKLKPATGS